MPTVVSHISFKLHVKFNPSRLPRTTLILLTPIKISFSLVEISLDVEFQPFRMLRTKITHFKPIYG